MPRSVLFTDHRPSKARRLSRISSSRHTGRSRYCTGGALSTLSSLLSIALSLSKGDGGLSRAELLGSYRPPSLVSTFANGEHLR